MSFVARNHPQQTAVRGVDVDRLFDLSAPPGGDDVDDRGTEWALFDELHTRFAFTVDAAAAAHNAKLPRYYDAQTNGLAQDWTGERVWCNPPYSNIEPWIRKANGRTATLVVMLLPANLTEQSWWQDHVEPGRRAGTIGCEFLRGRLRFYRPGEQRIGPNNRPPFGCCLLIWEGPA